MRATRFLSLVFTVQRKNNKNQEIIETKYESPKCLPLFPKGWVEVGVSRIPFPERFWPFENRPNIVSFQDSLLVLEQILVEDPGE